MTGNKKKKGRRLAAAALAAVLTVNPVAVAESRAAESQTDVAESQTLLGIPCDETLYITLGPNGGVEESSVVKRYGVQEDGEILDYGDYEKVTNLTTQEEPQIQSDGTVRFPVKAADGAFYFEGEFPVREEELPWDIQVKYLLNGVETPAEKLAGESGLVEILVDIIPNRQVSDYYRNNMALTLAALVDRDEVLSFRAEGAQLQTVGNMSAAVFFALPGEECHYTVAIGSDDFTFTGLMFVMTPLTLAQLEDVKELRDAKETLEDSAEAMEDSLDVILDTMDQMKNGISDTAAGLRELDQARGLFQGKKQSVYDQADQAMAQLDALADTLEPFQSHTEEAQQALEEVRVDLNDLMDDVDELGPKLGDIRDTVRYLRSDLEMMEEVLAKPEAGAAAQRFGQLLESTKQHLTDTMAAYAGFEDQMGKMAQSVARIQANRELLLERAALLEDLDLDTDYDPEELMELLEGLEDEIPLIDDRPEEEIEAALADTALTESALLGLTPDTASASNWTAGEGNGGGSGGGTGSGSRSAEYGIQNMALDQQDLMILQGLLGVTDPLLSPQNGGLLKDMAEFITLAQQVIQMAGTQKGNMGAAAHEAKDLLTNVGKLCDVAEDVLSDVDELDQTLNDYHGEARETLEDLGRLTDQASVGIRSLSGFFRSLEDQLKTAGTTLDEGTRQTLNGLADVLDHAGEGLGQTGVLRNAKDTVHRTVEDEWDRFSDEHTTILDVDLDAKPVSFTSDKNPAPSSIQIVLRTREISKDEDAETPDVDETFHPEGSILSRIGAIFRRIWEAVCSLFR